MPSDVYLSPLYWCLLACLLGSSAWIAKARIIGFGFMALTFASQFVAHSFVLFGWRSEIFLFCLAFWAFLATALSPRIDPAFTSLTRNTQFASRLSRSTSRLRHLESPWLIISKAYLITYGLLRLLTYPWLGGELDLDARIQASYDNRFVFFMGLGLLPPIAAVATQWLRRNYRLGLIDWLTLLLTLAALVVSGSKATVVPAAVAAVGASYLARRPLRARKYFIGAGAVAGTVGLIGYGVAVGSRSLTDTFNALLFRIAANTDSLDYLAGIDARPQDYPFAGIGALIPTLAKRMGYPYEYPPGVWLYGQAYGRWEGYGPNPGIIMDYFANVGWLGVIFAVLIGLYCRYFSRVAGAVGAAFASVTYLSLADITLFQAGIFFWLAVAALLVLARGIATRIPAARNILERALWPLVNLPIWIGGGFPPAYQPSRELEGG